MVVPDGDETARRAAGRLVTEAQGDPLLRVAPVSVSRPMVPDRDTESGALVVLSAGSWTAEELTGIGEACADGGHEVVGVVVAGTVRTRPARSAGRPPAGRPAADANAADAAADAANVDTDGDADAADAKAAGPTTADAVRGRVTGGSV